MTDSLNPVAVGIDHEGGKIVGMILRSQAWFAIISTTTAEGGRVKRLNRGPIGRTDAYVHATRR